MNLQHNIVQPMEPAANQEIHNLYSKLIKEHFLKIVEMTRLNIEKE